MGIIFGCPLGTTLDYTLVIVLWRQFFTWRICQTYPPPEPRQFYILKQTWCLSVWQFYILKQTSVRLFVEVLKPRSLLKLSPRTRGPKNYSGPQSHTFTSLVIESQVLRAQKLFKTSITHFYFFIYRVPNPRVLTNLGPKSQHPGFKLPTGVPTIKESNDKKKPGVGRAAPRCVEPRE